VSVSPPGMLTGGLGQDVPVAMSLSPFPVAKALWGMVMKLTSQLSVRQRSSMDMTRLGLPIIQALLPSSTPAAQVPDLRKVRLRIRGSAAGAPGAGAPSAFIFNPFEKRGGSVDKVAASRLARVFRLLAGAGPEVGSGATGPVPEGALFQAPRGGASGDVLAYIAGSSVRCRIAIVNPLPIPLRIGVSVVARLSSSEAGAPGW
jgi:hypothetical protein